MTRNRYALPLTLAVLILAIVPCLAVAPATWNQATEADFSHGQFVSTVVNSHGQVSLAAEVKPLLESDLPPVLSCIAVAGDTVYVGNASKAEVLTIQGGKTQRTKIEGATMVCSLLAGEKQILVGVGGDKGGIYRLEGPDKVTAVWTDAKAKYVWAMLEGPNGSIYAATGPTGTVYAIDAAGKATALYEAPTKLAKNILCLAAGKDGLLYAGTDTNGLVIEIDALTKNARVVLDAEQKEVSAIVVDPSGCIYAATSDASLAGGEGGPSHSGKIGRAGLIAPPTTSASSPEDDPMPSSTGPTTEPAATESAVNESDDEEGSSSGDAEDSGDSEMPTAHAGPSGPSHGPMISSPSEMSGGSGPGNSVYCIQKDGLVNVIFHRPVTILSMIKHDGKLLLGTGNNGTIYSVSLDGDTYSQLARTEAKQIVSLAQGKDGQVFFATANKGGVARIGKDLAKEGTFTSKALDARQIAKWGTIRLSGKAPEGTTLMVSTRGGNVSEPDDKTWGAWSKDQPLSDDYLRIESPAARFLQYRIRMTSKGAISPELDRISIVYQVGNLAPQLAKVVVQAVTKDGQGGGSPRGGRGAPFGGGEQGEEKAPKFMRHIQIQASDPNNDQLIYSIFFRQVGTENWIKIADKLREGQYLWDTRTVGDGEYELKVVASDSPSNPPGTALEAVRTYQPVTVDNTPPVIKDLLAKVNGLAVSVTGLATDTSRIAAIHYAVDSQEDWVPVLPVGGIADSNQAKFAFDIKNVKEGSHRLAVKVDDIYGNTGYSTVTVTVGK